MKLAIRLISIITLTVVASYLPSITAHPRQGLDSDLEKRAKAYEEACVLSLRTINTAQGTYRGGDETKGFAPTLAALGPKGAGMLDPIIAGGKKDGYRFRVRAERTALGKPVQHYTVSARPMKWIVKNQRSFFTDETGVIRFTTEDRPATNADTPLDLPSH